MQDYGVSFEVEEGGGREITRLPAVWRRIQSYLGKLSLDSEI